MHWLKRQERTLLLTMTSTPMSYAASILKDHVKACTSNQKIPDFCGFCPHTPSIRKSHIGELGQLLKVYKYYGHAVILLRGTTLGHIIYRYTRIIIFPAITIPSMHNALCFHTFMPRCIPSIGKLF